MASDRSDAYRLDRRIVLGAGLAGMLSCVPSLSLAFENLHPGRIRYKELYAFDKPSDTRILYLYGGVIQASDGCLYGLGGTDRIDGGARCGLIFQLDRAHRLRIVEYFDGSEGTGSMGSLMQASDGMLYGTTYFGGPFGNGTLYRLNAASELEVVHAFDSAETGNGGASFGGPMLEASDGYLYGTLYYGGVGKGSVYRLLKDGRIETLHVFKDVRNNGRSPWGGLIQASDGHLYGVTERGGEFKLGTVYRLTLDGEFTLLHSFDWSEGVRPRSGVVQARDGRLYGTTLNGSHKNSGTLFSISLDGDFRVIYRLGNDGPISGGIGSLLAASDGHLYGTSGGDGVPVLFRLEWGSELVPLLSDFAVSGRLCETREGALVGTVGSTPGPLGTASIFRIADVRDLR